MSEHRACSLPVRIVYGMPHVDLTFFLLWLMALIDEVMSSSMQMKPRDSTPYEAVQYGRLT